MTTGTCVEPEDLTETLLAVAGDARQRLTIVGPVVEPAAIEALREVLRPGVEVVVVSTPGSHHRFLALDRSVAVILSTNFTVVGTGLGWVEPTEDEEPREPNVEGGFVVEDRATVQKLLLKPG
jgi:hypothetical protein